MSRRDRFHPDHGSPPPVYLDGAALWSRAPYLRALLRGMCVPSQDAEDVVQEVMAGAWRAMLAGRFRPLPTASAAAARRHPPADRQRWPPPRRRSRGSF